MIAFPVFKEISFGGFSKEQLMDRLAAADIQFNEYALTLFQHPLFSVNVDREKIKLVKVNLSQLELNNPATFQEITSSASKFGLKLCPLVLGAFLRLEYLDQPAGAYLHITSKKPEADENYPNGFYIRNLDQKLWLRGYRASEDYAWSIDNEFIFIQ